MVPSAIMEVMSAPAKRPREPVSKMSGIGNKDLPFTCGGNQEQKQ